MKLKRSNTATYLSVQESNSTRKAFKVSSKFAVLINGLFAILLLATVAFVNAVPTQTAFADDEQEVFQKAAENFGLESSKEGMEEALTKYQKNGIGDNTSFGYVFYRLLSTGYMNRTPDGVAPSGLSERDENCDSSRKQTLLYHNCDVPNIMTEFQQDMAGLFMPAGAQYAQVFSNKMMLGGFGLPSNIPGDEVPVKEKDRVAKYTGLEVFGYNLKYSRYTGEWDHIKVMTSARALSNFGFFDRIELGANAVFDGLKGGMSTAWSGAVTGFKTGGIFNAIGGAIGGFFTGGTASSVNTILDSSDLNVFNMNAWYRVNFPDTLYNARQLSQEEISAVAQQAFYDMISSELPDEAKLPGDFVAIKEGPARPIDNISSCLINGVEKGRTTAPGTSQVECEDMGRALTTIEIQENADGEPEEVEKEPTVEWSIDGQQKGETTKEWLNKNSELLQTGSNYSINCSVPSNLSITERGQAIDSFYSCWSQNWNAAVQPLLQEDADKSANEFLDKMQDSKEFQEYLIANPHKNYNSPISRFVCTTTDGQDMKKTNGDYVYYYNQDGTVNEQCNEVRPTIQNGFFGNGYYKKADLGNQNLVDTRYTMFKDNFFNNIIAFLGVGDLISDFGLNANLIITRITNTILDFSFSPILSKLGISKIIADLVESFSDGIFFPLSTLFASAGALWLVFSFIRRRDGWGAIKSMGMIAVVFVFGTILLINPTETLKQVEAVPASIEKSIVGAIFNIGNSNADELCTATSGRVSSEGLKEGNYTYDDSARQIMCEVWRAYAFNPWVYGQWGTGYSNLHAETTKYENKLQNKNTSLVGNAKVSLGGNKSEYNWALYQLKVTSSGTTTTKDNYRGTGFVDPNFYRLVDLQAGPNNGALSDPRYLENWAGVSFGDRELVSILSPISAIIGLIAIAGIAFAKIQVTLTVTLMALFAPFMLLIGLLPGQGRQKLRGYLGDMLSLIVQRIVLITFLGVMLKCITAVTNSTNGYLTIFVVSCAVGMFFIMYRKTFIGFIEKAIGGQIGTMGSGLAQNPFNYVMENLPTSLRNRVQVAGTLMRSGTAGALAGAAMNRKAGVAGITRSAISGANESTKYARRQLFNVQRRKGFGIAESIIQASDLAVNEHIEKLKNSQAKYDISSSDALQESSVRRTHDDNGNVIVDKGLAGFEKRAAINRALSKIDNLSEELKGSENIIEKLSKGQYSEERKNRYIANNLGVKSREELEEEFDQKANSVNMYKDDKVFIRKPATEIDKMTDAEKAEYFATENDAMLDLDYAVYNKNDYKKIVKERERYSKITSEIEKNRQLIIEYEDFVFDFWGTSDINKNKKAVLDDLRQDLNNDEEPPKTN